MAKFNLAGIKGGAKALPKNFLMPVGLATAGIIGTQKFLDFKTLFPNVDPNKWFIKHEGAVKVGGVAVAFMLFQKMPDWAKWLLIGVAVQGAVKEIGTLTTNKEGKRFFEQIGAGDYDEQINSLAAEIKNATNEFTTGVGAGVNQQTELNPAVALNVNASTGVGGVGMDEFSLNGIGAF